MIEVASAFLKRVIVAAEQLSQPERWRLILSRGFVQFLGGRILSGPEMGWPAAEPPRFPPQRRIVVAESAPAWPRFVYSSTANLG